MLFFPSFPPSLPVTGLHRRAIETVSRTANFFINGASGPLVVPSSGQVTASRKPAHTHLHGEDDQTDLLDKAAGPDLDDNDTAVQTNPNRLDDYPMTPPMVMSRGGGGDEDDYTIATINSFIGNKTVGLPTSCDTNQSLF